MISCFCAQTDLAEADGGGRRVDNVVDHVPSMAICQSNHHTHNMSHVGVPKKESRLSPLLARVDGFIFWEVKGKLDNKKKAKHVFLSTWTLESAVAAVVQSETTTDDCQT